MSTSSSSLRNLKVLIVGYNDLTDGVISIIKPSVAMIKVFDEESEVPIEYYCSIRKQLKETDALIILDKKQKNLNYDLLKNLKKNSLVIDIFGAISGNIGRLHSEGFVKKYWTAAGNKADFDPSFAYVTKMSNFETVQFKKDLEYEAVNNLITKLGGQ